MSANKLHSIFSARERSSVARSMLRNSGDETQITIVSIEYLHGTCVLYQYQVTGLVKCLLQYVDAESRFCAHSSLLALLLMHRGIRWTPKSMKCLSNNEIIITIRPMRACSHTTFLSRTRKRTLFAQISAICWCELLSWLFSSIIFVAECRLAE